ncbi:MAG: hypothetical protein GVY19_09040 [Bacteroidetes bacterium]|jgi:hypothetical protein|nr:hypothetical protein [Bacteroidota bacterium]
MRKIFVIAVVLLSSCLIHAQGEKDYRVKGEKFAVNTFHLEALGNGMPYNIGYERVLTNMRWFNIGLGAGGGYFPLKVLPVMTANFEVTMLFGKSDHLFEMGIGSRVGYAEYHPKEPIMNPDDQLISVSKGGAIFQTFRMGYRYQPVKGGLFFRAGIVVSDPQLIVFDDLIATGAANVALFLAEKFDIDVSYVLPSFGIGFTF